MIELDVRGLDPNAVWHAWLIDNKSGGARGALPDPGDDAWNLGALRRAGDSARLKASLARARLASFEVDAVVVADARALSPNVPVVYGLPRAFQRLYTKARTGALARYASGPDALLRTEPSLIDRLAQLLGASEASAATIFVDADV